MGIILSRYNNYIQNSQCFICNKRINTENYIKCVRCNITLHNDCEETYRNIKKYCQCPGCKRIGSLGTIVSYTSQEL